MRGHVLCKNKNRQETLSFSSGKGGSFFHSTVRIKITVMNSLNNVCQDMAAGGGPK